MGTGIPRWIWRVSSGTATFTTVFLLFRAGLTVCQSSPDLPSVDLAPLLVLFQPQLPFFPSPLPSYPSQHSHSPSISIFPSISHSPQSVPPTAPSAKHYSHSHHFLLSHFPCSHAVVLLECSLRLFPQSFLRLQSSLIINSLDLQQTMESQRKGRFKSNDSIPSNYSTHCLAPFVRDALSPSFNQTKNGQIKKVAPDCKEERNEFQELKRHYECIERVLNEENLNLKMQAQYLASEMRKSLKREKSQREELRNAMEQYQRAKEKLGQTLQENLQTKEYIQSKVILLLNALKLTSLATLQSQVRLIIKQFCEYFNIGLDVKTSPIREMNHEDTIEVAQEEDLQVGSKIQQLNNKFQELMHQYKSTSHPQIRKQCIDIAKEIKVLKTGRESSLGNKTVQMLSRQQSNEYLSLRSKYSKVVFDEGSQVREVASELRPDKHLQRSSIEIQQRLPSRKGTMNRPSSFQNGQR